MQPYLIGIFIGVVLGCIGLWFIDRSHQATLKKLQDSRAKLERQRTQAVNDLFALRNEVESGGATSVSRAPSQDPKVAAEIASLKNLVVRADAALSVARRKRNEYEEEISRLRKQVGESDADVINLREDRSKITS